MKISFIIPAHNEERFLAKAIGGILAQPREFIEEIIVVNNASTDRTREIAFRFADDGVRVVDEPKKGLPFARKAGFQAAQGEIIASIDADSVIAESWAKTAAGLFEKNKKIAAVSGPYFYESMGALEHILNFLYIFLVILPVHWIVNTLGVSGIILGGNFAVRREALRYIEGYTKDVIFYGEDAYLAKRFRRAGPIQFSPKLYVHTSPRRFKKEGFIKVNARYTLNFFWVLFTGKPFRK